MNEALKKIEDSRRQHEREHAEWERSTAQDLRALKSDLQNLMRKHSGDALIMLEDFSDLLNERLRDSEPLWSDWL